MSVYPATRVQCDGSSPTIDRRSSILTGGKKNNNKKQKNKRDWISGTGWTHSFSFIFTYCICNVEYVEPKCWKSETWAKCVARVKHKRKLDLFATVLFSCAVGSQRAGDLDCAVWKNIVRIDNLIIMRRRERGLEKLWGDAAYYLALAEIREIESVLQRRKERTIARLGSQVVERRAVITLLSCRIIFFLSLAISR